MPEFPSTTNLLDSLMRRQPHTREGQWQVAEYIEELCQRYGLGTMQILEYEVESEGSYPLVCIDIEPNSKQGEMRDEVLIDFGHFDTVLPDYYPADFHRDPFALTLDPRNEDIGWGHGSGDMLGGITASLKTLRKLTKDDDKGRPALPRHYRFIGVTKEEHKSQGTYAALEQGLFKDATGLLTHEITVGDSMDHSAPLYNCRTGRVGLDLTIEGIQSHSGRIEDGIVDIHDLSIMKFCKVIPEIMKLRFQGHPAEFKFRAQAEESPTDSPTDIPKTLPPVPGYFHSTKMYSLSVADKTHVHIDIFFMDPQLGAPDIEHSIRQAIENVLKDSDSYKLRPEKRGGKDFIGPWHTSFTHPLVEMGKHYQQEVLGDPGKTSNALQSRGRGVADEGIPINHLNIPGIGWAPDNEGEHTREERVGISSIKQRAAWSAKLAAHAGKLTE